jgi:sugar/nucleoside kinase (ribokinase family)
MKLLVIGHSVVDTIHYKTEATKKPGGIFYSVLALDCIKNYGDEIYLCTALSKKDEYLFSALYNKTNGQFVSYLNKMSQVSLTLYDEKEREEKYSRLSPNLELPENNLNYFDGILINMITGFDISVEQFQQLRKDFKGLIYFDVHTFSRGISKDMKRFFRQIPNFNNWAKNIDILQANDKELKTLSNRKDEEEISRELLAYGIKIVIITKAESGIKAYYKNEDRIESVFVTAKKFKVQNSVGCGDVFGAIFFYNYIRNKDIIESLKTANNAAGYSTTYKKIEDYKKLKTDVFQGYS